MVGDDHLEPCGPSLGDLLDRRDPAVDGEDERALLLGQSRQRVPRDPVALLETAGEMPLDVGAEAAQGRDREGGRADPVHVVVAVDADPPAGRDRLSDQRAGRLHVPEQKRVVAGRLGGQKGPRRLGVAVAPPDEDGCRRFTDVERPRRAPVPPCGGTDASSRCPRASRSTVGLRSDGPAGPGGPRLSLRPG